MGMTTLADVVLGIEAVLEALVLPTTTEPGINAFLEDGDVDDENRSDSRVFSVMIREDEWASGVLSDCWRTAWIEIGVQYRRNKAGRRLQLTDSPVLDELVTALDEALADWSAAQSPDDPIPVGSLKPPVRLVDGIAFDTATFPRTKSISVASFALKYHTSAVA